MIDEKKLVERLQRCISVSDNANFTNGLLSAIDIINQQPKIGEWIPCSEKFPPQPKENPVFENKPLELYLADCGVEYPFRVFWNGKFFTDGFSKIDVIAWQPLPEPYKP